jgi:hypothetical protein
MLKLRLFYLPLLKKVLEVAFFDSQIFVTFFLTRLLEIKFCPGILKQIKIVQSSTIFITMSPHAENIPWQDTAVRIPPYAV